MLIYILLFLTVALTALSISPQKQYKRENILLFYFAVAFAALTCGLRDMLGGYDSYIYGEIFDTTAERLKDGQPAFTTTAWIINPKENGYGLYNLSLIHI